MVARPPEPPPGGLLDAFFGGSPADAIFSEGARLQAMLDVEAGLARAQARLGVIPRAAARSIVARCRAELFDAAALGRAVVDAGVPTIPLVRRLTQLVAAADAEAARYVHWGATSQDIVDTGLVLQARALLDLLDGDLERLSAALAALAAAHRATAMVGRTWLQHALPITFGLKAAGWLDAVERHRARLRELRPRLLVVQLGGAAGTLASLGDRGLAVTEALAEELGLAVPDLPWHGARDRFAELGASLGLLVGTLGKIARDLSLLMQTEVGEVYEPAAAGRGGSSTMPQKRNPVAAAAVLAIAARTPGLVATLLAGMAGEQERGLGGWQAEWSVLPEIGRLAAGASRRMADTLAGLEVDAGRMRANLDLTLGLVLSEAVMMALGSRLGRLAAHDLVERACHRAIAERRHLRAVLAEEPAIAPHLAAGDLERLFDPKGYLGVSRAFVDRVLAARRRRGKATRKPAVPPRARPRRR